MDSSVVFGMRCILSVERQKGLITDHLPTPLDPFVSKLMSWVAVYVWR